jgi:two-component system response regulator DevR
MPQIKVFIADDHHLVREGISQLIGSADEMEVVGETGVLEEILEAVKSTRPHVVLLDVLFPEGPSFSICTQIKEALPETKVVFLTGLDDERTVQESILSEGDGFLLKGVKYKEFVSAIRDVMAGKSIIDPTRLG